VQSASTLAAQASERARDPNQTGTSQTNVISLLSFAQQVVNGILGHVVDEGSLPLVSRQVIYPIFANLPAAVRILALRDASGRDLVPLGEFSALQQVNTGWPSAVSDSPRSWTLCGRDLLIVYPGVAVSPPTLTPVYSELTTTLTAASTTEVTNDDDDALLDLTEVLLLLKSRDLPDCKKIIERFKARMDALAKEPK
jgi:hypothetical protein